MTIVTSPFRRSLCLLLAVAGGVSAAAGCGVDDTQSASDLTSVQSEIIGGLSVTTNQRRTWGLVGVNEGNDNDCSGVLISPDWVLTAAHCIYFFEPGINWVRAPRPDGSEEQRYADAVDRVGTADLALVHLAAGSSDWPQVSRTVSSTSPASLVGQTATCYGRGYTTYTNPGLSGQGTWRSLTHTFDAVDTSDNTLKGLANNGQQAIAYGDSGGPCFRNGQLVGIAVRIDPVCTNMTNNVTCAATMIRIDASYWRSLAEFKAYIDGAPQRPPGPAGTAEWNALGLQNGWFHYGWGTNAPSFALIDGTIHLRGAIATGGTNMLAFKLGSSETPTSDVYVPVDLCDAHKGRLWIHADGWVEVQALGGGVTYPQCFTSLDGASFKRNNTGATNLSLTPGWTNSPYSTRPAAVSLDFGVVRLQGAIAWGNSQSPFSLSELPPSGTVYIPVDLCNAAKGRLVITSGGAVTVEDFGGGYGAAWCFTSLEGASYSTGFGFETLTLKPGWFHYGSGTRVPRVANINGTIRFQGAIATSGPSQVAFTLPGKFRPATEVYVPVDLCNGDKGRLYISKENGDVKVEAENWANAQCFTSLEGAWFGL